MSEHPKKRPSATSNLAKGLQLRKEQMACASAFGFCGEKKAVTVECVACGSGYCAQCSGTGFTCANPDCKHKQNNKVHFYCPSCEAQRGDKFVEGVCKSCA